MQEFQALAKVVSMAFGGKKKDNKEHIPSNFAEAQMKLANLLGKT